MLGTIRIFKAGKGILAVLIGGSSAGCVHRTRVGWKRMWVAERAEGGHGTFPSKKTAINWLVENA